MDGWSIARLRNSGLVGLWLLMPHFVFAQFPIHFGAMQAGCNQYESLLRAQNPTFAWRIQEASGTNLVDILNASAGTLVGGPTRTAGPLLTAPSRALALNGSTQYAYSVASSAAPAVMTIGLWFKTSTATGGRLIGVSSATTGASGSRDRHIYMRNTGQLLFGIGANITIQSPKSYNDNDWHFAVATLSGAGMRLYVDGVLVASSASTAALSIPTAYVRVGYDSLAGWASAPSSSFFNGQIAEPFFSLSAAWAEARITDLYEMGKFCRTFEAPTLTSIAPRQGIGAGGGVVTVTGAGFMAPMEVWIAGRECTALTIVNDTTATCTVPANANGNSAIEYANVSAVVGGRATTVSNLYGYIGAPLFWLDSTAPNSLFTATNCTGAAGNGAAVACWRDLSGNNINFTQATAGARPTNVVGAGLDFDGTADFMSGTLTAIANTAAVSFAGWVNLDTTSTQYVGFLFHRGTLNATGMNATTSATQIGYHWNDASNTYGWNSGLTYSAGAWNFLGLALSTSAAVGYRNTGTATNSVSHTALAIGGKSFDLGRDSNGGRFLDGKIEKAGMWNQTLNATQMGVIRDSR